MITSSIERDIAFVKVVRETRVKKKTLPDGSVFFITFLPKQGKNIIKFKQY